jgi:hypothetical protein
MSRTPWPDPMPCNEGDHIMLRAWWRGGEPTLCRVVRVTDIRDHDHRTGRLERTVVGLTVVPVAGNPHTRSEYDFAAFIGLAEAPDDTPKPVTAFRQKGDV